MLLRIYWIKQIAFLYTSQATTSELKNDVNLLRAILHCARSDPSEKTISTWGGSTGFFGVDTSQVWVLRWLNTVWAVCEYMLFAKSWQGKGCSSQAETWQVKNILMKDFDWHVKCEVFIVSMATCTIEYNLKISLLLSLHKIRSLDFPISLHTAYYN